MIEMTSIFKTLHGSIHQADASTQTPPPWVPLNLKPTDEYPLLRKSTRVKMPVDKNGTWSWADKVGTNDEYRGWDYY